MAWFTLVKAIGPKLQIKTFTCFWEDAPTDLTEKEARPASASSNMCF